VEAVGPDARPAQSSRHIRPAQHAISDDLAPRRSGLAIGQTGCALFGHYVRVTTSTPRGAVLEVVATQANEGTLRMPTVTGAHHVAFTIQDGEASAAWYQDLFGMQLLLRADDENVRVRVLVHPDSELIIGLREYPGHDDGAFREFRTGLDHIAFAVSSREELEAWQDVLAEKGTSFSPIVGITDRHAGRAARPGQHPARALVATWEVDAARGSRFSNSGEGR
jgi:glyoxylase I family protein